MWNVIFIDENPSELLKVAHSSVVGSEDTDVKWMSPADVKKKYKKYHKSCSFIFSSFEGNTYEYIKDLQMTIFGPQLIIDYVRSENCLPKVEVPLFSTALKDAIICFSAFSDVERVNLAEKIEMMHGTVIKDLTLSVKVLVSTNVGTKKVRVAIEKGIPVVLESWIHFLWSSSAVIDPIDGLEAEIIDKYRIPVFYNLKICLSGLTIAERSEAENIITKNGGEYCRDLTVGHCTHLITKEPTGKKYHYALKWRIQIVNCKWLADSIVRGYSVDEAEYPVSNSSMPVSGSTPNKDETINNFHSSDYSAISQSGPIDETRFSGYDDDGVPLNEQSDDMESATNGIPAVPVGNTCSSINDVDFDDPMTEEIAEPIETPVAITAAVSATENLQFLDNYLSNDDTVGPTDAPSNVNNNGEQDDTIALLEETKLDNNERVGLFGRCQFALMSSLAEDERKIAEALITEHGGLMTRAEIATHIIVPSISIDTPAPKSTSAQVVTLWYLQTCVKSRCLLKCTDDFLFEPVSTAINGGARPLAGTVLSFSGYPGDERKLLKAVACALGAAVQDKLARRAVQSRGILATTHLIMGRPDRTKLPSCRAWGVPAVSKKWLGACALAGRLIPVEEYEVVEGGAYDHNMSMMSTCTAATAMDMSVMDGPTDIPTRTDDMGFKTPPPRTGGFRNPILDKVRAAGAGSLEISMGELNSPIMRIAAGDYLTATKKIDITDIDVLRTPEHYEPRRGVSHASQKLLDQSVTTPDIAKALQARLAMMERGSDAAVLKNNGNQHGMDSSFSYIEPRVVSHPLAAVVVYVAQSMSGQQLAMKEIIERLGGEFSWIYNNQVTHVICSAMSESARCREELLTASKAGKVLVSCDWLRACDFEKRRVDESIYVIVSNSIVNVSVRKRKASPDLTESETSSGSSKSAKLSPELAAPRNLNPEPEKVGWQYQDKSMSRSQEHDSQCTQLSEAVELENLSSVLGGQDVAPRVIMLHSISAEIRDKYEPEIRRLGADLENDETAISRVTHLVCTEPGRNAKYLSAIAAGVWVVHTSFIDDSIEAGRWLDESRYEWGGPCTAQFLADIPRKAGETVSAALREHEASLAEAARRLRQLGGGLAFRDWRVCILDVPAKATKFAMIIEAGGGVVLDHQPLPDIGEVTHFLVSKTFLPGMSAEVAKYTCYKVDLISYFLAARNEHENKKIVKKFLISSKEVASLTKSGGGANTTTSSRSRRSRKL